jgi:hypothetical protein
MRWESRALSPGIGAYVTGGGVTGANGAGAGGGVLWPQPSTMLVAATSQSFFSIVSTSPFGTLGSVLKSAPHYRGAGPFSRNTGFRTNLYITFSGKCQEFWLNIDEKTAIFSSLRLRRTILWLGPSGSVVQPAMMAVCSFRNSSLIFWII